MARDNITSSGNYIGGAGGFEGGITPTESPTPSPVEPEEAKAEVVEEVPEESVPDDKVVIEDIDLIKIFQDNKHDELVQKMYELYQLKKINKGEAKKLEQEIREELENRRATHEDVESSESIIENIDEDEKDDEQLNEIESSEIKQDIQSEPEVIHEVVETKESVKKKHHRKRYEGSNIFAKMWHGFFEVFDFKSHSEEKMVKGQISVALLISFISMFHVQGLFELVNEPYLAWAISISIELAVIVSLFSLKMLERVSAWMIWLLIGSLFFVQGLGNTFSAYIWFSMKGTVMHDFFIEMVNMLGADPNSIGLRRVVSVILGGFFPFFALLMVKSVSEYLDNSEDEDYEYEWDTEEE